MQTLQQINPDAAAFVDIAQRFSGPNHDGDTLDDRMDKTVLFIQMFYGITVDADTARVARWALAGEPLDGPEYERCVEGVAATREP